MNDLDHPILELHQNVTELSKAVDQYLILIQDDKALVAPINKENE